MCLWFICKILYVVYVWCAFCGGRGGERKCFILCSIPSLFLSSFFILPEPSAPDSFPHSEDDLASSFRNAVEPLVSYNLSFTSACCRRYRVEVFLLSWIWWLGSKNEDRESKYHTFWRELLMIGDIHPFGGLQGSSRWPWYLTPLTTRPSSPYLIPSQCKV